MTKKRVVAEKLNKSGASKSTKPKIVLPEPKAKTVAEPNKGGRPTVYTDDIAALIMARIAQGESLVTICKDDGLPARPTVMRWLQNNTHAGFRDNYARAHETQADFYASEIIEIADEIEIEATYKNESVSLDVSSSAVARNRLRIDARKWYASKLAPKKYGDKLSLDAEINVTQLTPEQRADKIAQLQAKLQKKAPA